MGILILTNYFLKYTEKYIKTNNFETYLLKRRRNGMDRCSEIINTFIDKINSVLDSILFLLQIELNHKAKNIKFIIIRK